MLSASKELRTIKSKRKKSIREFNPLEGDEEKKDYKSKRMKQNNEENQKITEWLQPKITKKEKKEKKERQEKNEHEPLEGEEINSVIDSLMLNNSFVRNSLKIMLFLLKLKFKMS